MFLIMPPPPLSHPMLKGKGQILQGKAFLEGWAAGMRKRCFMAKGGAPLNPSMGINPESSFRGTPAVHDFEEFGWGIALS